MATDVRGSPRRSPRPCNRFRLLGEPIVTRPPAATALNERTGVTMDFGGSAISPPSLVRFRHDP